MQQQRGPAFRRALLIEPQALFAPYFVATLQSSGLDVVMVAKRPGTVDIRAFGPDIVFVDAAHHPVAPLRSIRALRRAAPYAHIVVYAAIAEGVVWHALARSIGADVVVSGRAGERDLIRALVAERP